MESTTNNVEFTPDHLDAINQVFAEFRLAFHNQFLRAFPNDKELMMAKQLWLHALSDIPCGKSAEVWATKSNSRVPAA